MMFVDTGMLQLIYLLKLASCTFLESIFRARIPQQMLAVVQAACKLIKYEHTTLAFVSMLVHACNLITILLADFTACQ